MSKNNFLIFCLVAVNAAALNPDINAVNNSAGFNLGTGLQYFNNYPYLSNGFHLTPGTDLQGQPEFINVTLDKTYQKIYTHIELGILSTNLNYHGGLQNFSSAKNYQFNSNVKLGYSFSYTHHFLLTPYFYGNYQNWQTDTGGYTGNEGLQYQGYTQVWQNALLGLGLLGQWNPQARLVISADANYGQALHPWTWFNATQTSSLGTAVVYQQANFASHPFWQASLSGDYAITPKLHGRMRVDYQNANFGSGQTGPELNLPVTTTSINTFLASAGLAYQLDGPEHFAEKTRPLPARQALIQANNEIKILPGYLYQNYGETVPGVEHYLDRQAGSMPFLNLTLDKTWHNFYSQLSLQQAIGNTQYTGSTLSGVPLTQPTRNTMTDLAARLGYQCILMQNLSFTPFATVGYHYWLRAIQGQQYQNTGLEIFGYPETYQNSWYGLGLLSQWAPLDAWVVALTGMYGMTFNAMNRAWNTFNSPYTIATQVTLNHQPIWSLAFTSDYAFTSAWHFLVNVNYQRFSYGASNPDLLGISEPSSTTTTLMSSIGVGYSFA